MEDLKEVPEDEEDEEEAEPETFEQMEEGTQGTSNEESDDVDKSNRVSQSATSSSLSYAKRWSARIYGRIFQDIHKQKRRRTKLDEAKQERRRIARSHLEKAIEGTNCRIPDDVECQFDTTKTGFGGAMLTEDYRTALLRGKRVESSASSAKGDNNSLKFEKTGRVSLAWKVRTSTDKDSRTQDTSDILSTSSSGTSTMSSNTQTSSVRGSKESRSSKKRWSQELKLRFTAPEHIEKRLPAGRTIPWFNERLELSTLSVRYEIPMEFRKLENMDIMPYLYNYCRISEERMTYYRQFYKSHKSPKTKIMTSADLTRAVHEILYNSVPEEAISRLVAYLKITEVIDMKVFSVVAATAERLLYLSFAETVGRVPPGVVRPFIEGADFDGLKMKLDKVCMNKRLMKLLESLG